MSDTSELSVTPDVELKSSGELIAQNAQPSPRAIRRRSATAKREATLPKVAVRVSAVARVKWSSPATRRGALMPDLRGQSVRDVARTCAQLGLKLEARGEGRAIRQSPLAGAEVNSGQPVQVEFGRNN
jgi:hypothetical protein